jgi:zinc transport system substrate-binding protein
MSRKAGTLLLLLLLTSSAGCISSSGTDASDAIGVVVSIPPYAEWVREVGGDYVDVTILIPEGSSPHTYEVTPQQMVRVSKASLWVKNGVGLEHWADKIVQTNEDIAIVDISSGVELIGNPDDGGMYDAHVWLSPHTARQGVEMIADTLSAIDPSHREYYTSRCNDYLGRLSSIESEILAAAEAATGKTFLVYHPAWAYFARDFGLTQIAVEDEGKEPGPEYLATIIELARERGITVVFVEPQFSPDDVQVIANEIGGTVVSINPLAETYLDNLQLAAEAIMGGLA